MSCVFSFPVIFPQYWQRKDYWEDDLGLKDLQFHGMMIRLLMKASSSYEPHKILWAARNAY
jgi:hypothetical protein